MFRQGSAVAPGRGQENVQQVASAARASQTALGSTTLCATPLVVVVPPIPGYKGFHTIIPQIQNSHCGKVQKSSLT